MWYNQTMEIKLFWKPDLGNAYLVTEKMPRREQPVFARVYIKNDREQFLGWSTQIYTSTLWPDNIGALERRPCGVGGSTHDSFKKARKNAEDHIVRWFRGLGIDVIIETPEFEKEELWAIKKQR